MSDLYSLRPEFFRYIDNAKGLGYKFELTQRPEGWSITRPGLELIYVRES